MIGVENWALLLVAISSLFLGVFVYFKGQKIPVNQAWFRFSIATALWAFSTDLMISSLNLGWAIFWARASHLAFSLVPSLFLEFNLSLLNNISNRWRELQRWNLALAWIFGLLGSCTPLLINDI